MMRATASAPLAVSFTLTRGWNNGLLNSVPRGPTKGLLDSSPEYAYREFEKVLDFVFYDGDKNTQKENLEKSTADVIRILNTAHERIYICDAFFDAKALGRFVLSMESRTVPVRILSGKKELKTDGKRIKLAEAINEMNSKGISNITCRLLTGQKAYSLL